MALTVAQIAKLAFDAAARALSGVVKTAQLRRTTYDGTRDVANGTRGSTVTTFPCRAISDTAQALSDKFPEYVAGPTATLYWLEGLSVIPAENDQLVIGAATLNVDAVGDVVASGGLFAVVAI